MFDVCKAFTSNSSHGVVITPTMTRCPFGPWMPRFANPKVTKDDVLQLKDEVLTETLAYTPGWSQMSPVEDACTIARLQGRAPRTPCSKDSVGTNGSNGHNPSFDDSSVEKKEVLMREAVQNLPSIIKAPGMRASLLLTAGLMVFEQGSGMTALFYYGGEQALSRA